MTAVPVEDRAGNGHPDVRPVELGAWTLEYLGPGLRMQLRICHRGPRAQISGFISPAIATQVFLTPVAPGSKAWEAEVSASGRFEFASFTGGGAHRLTVVTTTADRPFTTPPFWV